MIILGSRVSFKLKENEKPFISLLVKSNLLINYKLCFNFPLLYAHHNFSFLFTHFYDSSWYVHHYFHTRNRFLYSEKPASLRPLVPKDLFFSTSHDLIATPFVFPHRRSLSTAPLKSVFGQGMIVLCGRLWRLCRCVSLSFSSAQAQLPPSWGITVRREASPPNFPYWRGISEGYSRARAIINALLIQ